MFSWWENTLIHLFFFFFLCVEVFRPSQPNGVMSSAVSLPNYTFTGQAQSSKRLISIVHILSPETDNCPSWMSGRERMTIENISWSISTKECCRPRRGLNPRPPGLQSDGASNWATEAGPWSIYARTQTNMGYQFHICPGDISTWTGSGIYQNTGLAISFSFFLTIWMKMSVSSQYLLGNGQKHYSQTCLNPCLAE